MSYENNMSFDVEMEGAVLINGEDGISPIVEVETIEGGNRVTITDKDGEKAFDVMDGQPGQPGQPGDDGKDGKDGYTPQKGVDYWTPTDKAEIVDDVLEQVQNPMVESIGDKSLVGNATDLNTASGKWSVALNYNNTASGNNAVATGTVTTASGAAALSANCGTEAKGDISTAFGNYTKATTTYAFTSGDHTEANGVASFAANHNNKANGQNSFATGSTNTITTAGKNGFVSGASNTVSGESSSAFGLLNEVSGKYSHAFGQQNSVTHNYSSANGYNQKNGGHFSHTFNHSTETVADNQSAFGKYNKASYDSLFMIGNGTSDTARKNAFEVKSNGTVMIGNAPLTEEKVNSIGNSSGITDADKQEIIDEVLNQIPDATEQLVKAGTGTNSTISNDHSRNIASGNYSHAEGKSTEASGYCSHAEGSATTASKSNAHAEGYATKATGEKAHAEGSNTNATGESAHAEGQSTEASGRYSHAEGQFTDAFGLCSHSEGYESVAQGNYSHAEGYESIANGEHQHVQGKYNVIDNANKYAHIVGNGDYNSSYGVIRSNAHTVDWNGLGWFAGGLKVGGTGQDDESAVDIIAYIQALEERIKALEG